MTQYQKHKFFVFVIQGLCGKIHFSFEVVKTKNLLKSDFDFPFRLFLDAVDAFCFLLS